MNSDTFTRQYLLTKQKVDFLPDWKNKFIGEYQLFTHPKLEVEDISNTSSGIQLILLGYIFDYRTPELSNLDILKDLSRYDFSSFIRELDKYTGQFVIIRNENDLCSIISDAGAQREVYYTTDFSTFASQPILINKLVEGIPCADTLMKEFYQSDTFNKNRVYIGDSTQWDNIKHLVPNHYIDILKKDIVRFFPYKLREENPFEYVVDEAAKRIKGFLKAVSLRYPKVAMPVTAGYDSRLLFAASVGIDCRYFIYKHRKLSENHYDVSISRELLRRHKLDFEVISYDEVADAASVQRHSVSVDFPRPINTAMIFNGYEKLFSDYIVLDTIMSELARNRYGNFKFLNAQELAILNHYKGNSFVISAYDKWLKRSQKAIVGNGYNIPDLFYWEEIMGNWAAKSKTECMLGTEFFSLLNSRDLITLMMSVPIKYRQPNNNILYNTLIEKMSPKAISLPMNPSRKTSFQILLQKFRVFDIYRFLKIKLKM